MKIDKRNYRHWLYLLCSGAFLLLGACLRPLTRRPKLVVLYGHKLNGNIKAFADYVERTGINGEHYTLAYATLDPAYYEEVKATDPPVEVLNMRSLRDSLKIASASAIMTTHGLHTLALLKKLTSIKFINVWHGIGWKGHSPEEFSFLEGYADTWVSSPTFERIYREIFKVESPLHVTGYARSDDAVNRNFSVEEIKRKYGIDPEFKKIILIAPTWEQGHGQHSIYPFGLDADTFFRSLNDAAKQSGSLIIFRSHLNSRVAQLPEGLDNLALMPYGQYPVVEDFLYMADILVSDWSSIVFDYAPLGRPVIFLEVPSPYARLCLDEKYRFGARAATMEQLAGFIGRYAKNPEEFKKEHGKMTREAIAAAYGDTLDGQSAKRYHERLLTLIEGK